jgi:hypothetical protein
MTTLHANVPDALYRQAAKLADQEKVSIDELVALALNAQISSWLTRESMEERAKRGSWKKFDRVMANVPDVAPPAYDRLPKGFKSERVVVREKRAKYGK